MGESVFDKMVAEAVAKWQPVPKSEHVPIEKHKQVVVRPEYRVGGKYRGRL